MKQLKFAAYITSLFACAAAISSTNAAAEAIDFKQFVKAGSYSMTIKVAGLPSGGAAPATPPATVFCVTDEQLSKNQFLDFKADAPIKGSSCQLRNVKQTKDSLAYDMVCDKEGVTASNSMTFANGNMKGITKTKLTGDKAASLPATMRDFSVEFESKYLGACQK